jgi:hypothetical protein
MSRELSTTAVFVCAFAIGASGARAQSRGAAPARAPIAAATGCLTQGPGQTWQLTNATDARIETPEPSSRRSGPAAAPAPAAPPPAPTAPKAGKNTYKLLGVEEFNAPAHKGHTVTVKGPLIAAGNEKRINIIVLQMVAASCGAGTTP